MERLRSLLRREESPVQSLSTDFATMEIANDKGKSNIKDDNHDMNSTLAVILDNIEELTLDKSSLEVRLAEVTSELERKTEESLHLKAKCADLLTSFELERRRFQWQQKYFERRIQELEGTEPEASAGKDLSAIRNSRSVDDLIDCNAFYETFIQELVQAQEEKNEELKKLREFYEDKLKYQSNNHEAQVSDIIDSQISEVARFKQDNEALIKDLLTGCEGVFDGLRSEYVADTKKNVELKATSGKGIIDQFKALSSLTRGIIVASITVIGTATAGWASWGFIVWVWPRLLAFAEVLSSTPETYVYLLAFINSGLFQSFLRSWEEGKSLKECLKSFTNTEFLSSALLMAPDLFKQFKKVPVPK